MAIILALPKLFDDVVSRFAAESTPIVNLFGWREPAKKLVNSARIIWVPGNPSGDLGTVGPAKYPGRNPRSLATLLENFYVEITAQDASAPENERVQYQAVRLAYDAWYRAIYLAAHGTVKVVSDTWMIEKAKERRFGAGIRAVCTIEAMLPDEPQTNIVSEGVHAGADITVSELDVDEHVIVEES